MTVLLAPISESQDIEQRLALLEVIQNSILRDVTRICEMLDCICTEKLHSFDYRSD